MTVAPASLPATTPEAKRPFRLRLGLALTALMVLAVLTTALIVHASWNWTASRNIETVVGSLNRQTADAVGGETAAFPLRDHVQPVPSPPATKTAL